METLSPKLSIAVVGAGVAGITAAYLLGKRHDVTLIERNGYVGGHTNTISVPEESGDTVPVDTGFIVCNPKTYPNFYKLLAEWGVSLRDSEMSFGYYCETTGLGYVGPSIREFCRQYRNFFRLAFLGMILEQRRFNRRALADLDLGILDDMPLGKYLEQVSATPYFVNHYLLPLAAATWSSPGANMFDFPASTFIRFFHNHGMLDMSQPNWQTVVGGSQAYVRAFRSKFRGQILQNAPVRAVQRNPAGVSVHFHDRETKTFDRVVMAAHADESLKMLADVSDQELHFLSAWSYHRNSTLLHTDTSVLPPDRSLWASWNYRRRAADSEKSPVSINYYMNRLQGLKCKRDYIVSLNADHTIDPAKVIYSTEYTHPAYTPRSIEAQRGLRQLNGTNHTYFCGSYMGYGFHEDAVSSAVAVAGKLGVSL